MRICDYEEEHEPESRSRRASRVGHDLIFASEKPMTICQDCRQIIIDAAVFVPGMENNCFGIAHLRKLVPTPQKHRRHDVDKTAIVAAIDANAEWRAAVADFCLHRDEAINIDLEHYREMENGQKDAEAAKASLIPRLVANGKLPEHDAEGYFDWFLRERRRISP